jgi:predicted SnoaL-like aldol condensation-catalyzing enzyme
MTTNRIERIRALLKGIETGDPSAVSVISPTQYIQHNPQTQTGRDGLAALFARLSKTSPRVNIVRGFADGDFQRRRWSLNAAPLDGKELSVACFAVSPK